ncbi:MAG: ARPP-1 family domain-containing protein, partial [Planctomycetota bacterium]
MKKKVRKIGQIIVLAVLPFVVPSLESNAALARPEKALAKETIAEFLSSVRLMKKGYDFDHNGDGRVDMSVYLLKTETPDIKTKYTTLQEAIKKKQLALRENPNLSVVRKDPPSSYSIFAQYMGSGSLYYSRGSQVRGGWQNRGFGSGGILGRGYGAGSYGRRGSYGSYGSGRGSYGRRYPGYYKQDGFSGTDFKNSDPGGACFEDQSRSQKVVNDTGPAENPGLEVGALCFEKWRLIEESRRLGEPEYFTYAGMASPYVRRELTMFPNQTRAHKAIERELRRLGIRSKTRALADVFNDPKIKEIIAYYVANSKEVLDKNKGVSGMIITSNNRILCADVYASPVLFEKMFSQLMQSAAL